MAQNTASDVPLQPVDIHRALENVRQMEELQPQAPDMVPDWLNAINDYLNDILKAFRNWLTSLFPETPQVSSEWGDLFAWLAGLADYVNLLLHASLYMVLVVLLCMAFTLLRRLWMSKRATEIIPAIQTVEGTLLKTFQYHRKEAQRFAQNNQYDHAVRELYLSLLALLDETRVVPFEANRTNLEYLQRMARLADPSDEIQQTLQQGFGQIARTFEGIRYGHKTTDADVYYHCEGDVNRIMRHITHVARQLAKQQEGVKEALADQEVVSAHV